MAGAQAAHGADDDRGRSQHDEEEVCDPRRCAVDVPGKCLGNAGGDNRHR
jgi:hypothetical protein